MSNPQVSSTSATASGSAPAEKKAAGMSPLKIVAIVAVVIALGLVGCTFWYQSMGEDVVVAPNALKTTVHVDLGAADDKKQAFVDMSLGSGSGDVKDYGKMTVAEQVRARAFAARQFLFGSTLRIVVFAIIVTAIVALITGLIVRFAVLRPADVVNPVDGPKDDNPPVEIPKSDYETNSEWYRRLIFGIFAIVAIITCFAIVFTCYNSHSKVGVNSVAFGKRMANFFKSDKWASPDARGINIETLLWVLGIMGFAALVIVAGVFNSFVVATVGSFWSILLLSSGTIGAYTFAALTLVLVLAVFTTVIVNAVRDCYRRPTDNSGTANVKLGRILNTAAVKLDLGRTLFCVLSTLLLLSCIAVPIAGMFLDSYLFLLFNLIPVVILLVMLSQKLLACGNIIVAHCNP